MPVTVDSNSATLVLFLIAAALGALGGLLADLATPRGKGTTSTGELERLHKNRLYYDLGWFASALLGVGAALVALAFFRPVTDVVTAGKTVHQWDPFRLVGLSVLVGFSGPKFLKLAQARLLNLVTAERAQVAVDVAKTGLQKLQDDAKPATRSAVKDVAAPRIQTAAKKSAQTAATQVRDHHQQPVPDDQLEKIVAAVGTANGDTADQVARDAAEAVASHVSAQVETLTAAIDAAVASNGAVAV